MTSGICHCSFCKLQFQTLASCLQKICSETTVVHVPTALTLSPKIAIFLSTHTHTLRLGDSAAKRMVYNHTAQQRQRCRFTRCIHIQSNVMIHIKYINVFPDFSVLGFLLQSPSDQDNLTPSLSHSSLLSHLHRIIRVSFPIPIQSPTSDHSGPNPHQMLAHNKI